jgi:TetR/AcrR family transcriptional repressor of nem operon
MQSTIEYIVVYSPLTHAPDDMRRDAEQTRERILDAAQEQVLRRGFASTSIDQLQEAAGISRGTFFYHFASKDDLARALIRRHAATDHAVNEDLMARAEKLASDPLQQALLFVALIEELFRETGAGEAGCLFASYLYEAGLFDDETNGLILGSIGQFRTLLGDKLALAMESHPPAVPGVDPYLLADLGYSVMQGAFILSRALGDRELSVHHLRQFRSYLELLFGVVGEPV